MLQIISKLADIQGNYDALYCDLWGCLHNGIAPFPEAVAALRGFKEAGGKVVLLTNAPRPAVGVKAQLEGMGVSPELYDTIASSGDAALAALASGAFGKKVWHLGAPKDETFFENLALQYPNAGIERVELEEADGIVVTGLRDDLTETPDDYRLEIARGVNAGLELLCANPDIFVDMGERRLWCAGGIAQAYTAAGGTSRYFGKPHAPIYALARTRLNEIGGDDIPNERILCVGDGIATDMQGGLSEDLDTLFITGGLAREETGTTDQPVAEKLESFVAEKQTTPTYSIGMLR
ncbi:MAG: TIGR01459 family HAD-type hydrolase [Pseudomonadota bacterium]